MKTHNKRSVRAASEERTSFSLKANGIFPNHIVSAVGMLLVGLVLSGIISDVPPVYNHAFAYSMEADAEEIGALTQNMTASLTTVLNQAVVPQEPETVRSDLPEPQIVTKELPPVDYVSSLAGDLAGLRRDQQEEYDYNFSPYVTSISDYEVQCKLRETEINERKRELAEAAGQTVASSNKNLYLDTYSYQRGSSNIPDTGYYVGLNTDGIPISQLQMPEGLTFDENGVPTDYLYTIEGKATAYTGGTMTSTGSTVRQGVVAVDPREIPYGTEMWIVSADGKYVYGFARAEDTGGFIEWEKGATVDLYMNSYDDCCEWGWRGVKIFVLPTSYK